MCNSGLHPNKKGGTILKSLVLNESSINDFSTPLSAFYATSTTSGHICNTGRAKIASLILLVDNLASLVSKARNSSTSSTSGHFWSY